MRKQTFYVISFCVMVITAAIVSEYMRQNYVAPPPKVSFPESIQMENVPQDMLLRYNIERDERETSYFNCKDYAFLFAAVYDCPVIISETHAFNLYNNRVWEPQNPDGSLVDNFNYTFKRSFRLSDNDRALLIMIATRGRWFEKHRIKEWRMQ